MSDPSITAAPVEVSERRLHPAYLLISAGKSLRAALPVVIGLAVWARYWWIFVAAGLALLGFTVLGWWTTRYQISAGTLRLRSGYFNKVEQTVPLSRITGIEAKRGLIQRLFGVWALSVQTPGDGESATVTLSCLTQQSLDEVRAALAGVPGGAGLSVEPIDAGVLIARLSFRQLLVAAVTGASLPLLLVGLGAVWSRAEELLPRDALRWIRHELLSPGRWFLVVPAVIMLGLVAAVIVTALRLARFTLIRDGDRLRITRGLLTQRAGTVVVNRIQGVRLVEGPLRLPFGYGALELEVAGVSDEKGGERTFFPLVRRSEVAELLSRALPEVPWTEPSAVPARARRHYPTLPTTWGMVAGGLMAALWWGSIWAWLAVVPAVLGLAAGLAQARAAAVGLTGTTVALRWHRVLSRHTLVARRRRVQLTELTTTWPQRRSGLSGLRLKLSSGRSARLRHLEADQAGEILRTVGRPLQVGHRSSAVARRTAAGGQ